MAGTLKIAFSRCLVFPHLKNSPSRNAVDINLSLFMLLYSLLMFPKAMWQTAFHLNNGVCTTVHVLHWFFCRITVPCCLFSAASPGAISLLQSDEVHPSSSSPGGLISWWHACPCMYVFWNPSKHSDLQYFIFVTPFFFFKIVSCSCKL